MRWKLLFVIVFGFAFASFAQKKSSVNLYGNWESEIKQDSHVTLIKINRDSTFQIQKDLAEDYYIKISGNRMIRSILNKDSVKVAMDTSFIKMKRNILSLTFYNAGKEKIISMERLKRTRHGSKGIIGSYSWKYPDGKTAFSKFTKDGKWIFRKPLQKLSGKCDIYNDNISFHFFGKEKDFVRRMFFVEGSRLMLRDNRTGKVEYYRRVDYFPR